MQKQQQCERLEAFRSSAVGDDDVSTIGGERGMLQCERLAKTESHLSVFGLGLYGVTDFLQAHACSELHCRVDVEVAI